MLTIFAEACGLHNPIGGRCRSRGRAGGGGGGGAGAGSIAVAARNGILSILMFIFGNGFDVTATEMT